MFGESDWHGIPNLYAGSHQSSFKLEVIWKSLQPSGLTRGDSVMFGRVDKPAF